MNKFLIFSWAGLFIISIFLIPWFWKILPLILLPVLWYLPRQTAPGGLLSGYLPLRWLSAAIIPVIFGGQILVNLFKKKPFYLGFIVVPLSFFIGSAVISGIINDISFFQILANVYFFIKYPLLFIAFINMDWPADIHKKFLKLFFFLLIIQIPEGFFRFLILGSSGDYISWSLGPWGTFDLGVYMLYATAILISFDILNGFRFYCLWLYSCFIWLAFFGEIKAYFMAAPAMAGLFFLFNRKQISKLKKYFLIILILFFFFTVSFFWESAYPGKKNEFAVLFGQVKNFSRTVTATMSGVYQEGGGFRRINGFVNVWFYLNHSGRLLFGMGPGSSMGGSFFGKKSLMDDVVPYYYKTQLAAILMDTGFLGLIIYYWMLLWFYFLIVKVKKKEGCSELGVLTCGLQVIWFLYAVIGPFYDLYWQYDSPSYIFYFFLAVIYKSLLKKQVKFPATG